jgi:hypothetical protein
MGFSHFFVKRLRHGHGLPPRIFFGVFELDWLRTEKRLEMQQQQKQNKQKNKNKKRGGWVFFGWALNMYVGVRFFFSAPQVVAHTQEGSTQHAAVEHQSKHFQRAKVATEKCRDSFT